MAFPVVAYSVEWSEREDLLLMDLNRTSTFLNTFLYIMDRKLISEKVFTFS
jgi:hypothetical protein